MDEPQTEHGKAAAASKANAAAQLAAADQAAAAAEAEAGRRRAQTAAARAAKAPAPEVDAEPPAPPEAEGCEGCREFQELTLQRLVAVERQVQAVGKIIATAAVAAAVIYIMSGRQSGQAEPAGIEG